MSGAFLSTNRNDAREREEERMMAEYHAQVARSSYRWATLSLVLAMVLIALPQLGLARWNWYVVGATALVMTVLAVRMMMHGRISNGLVCLLCAFAVLPGWIFIHKDVVATGYDFSQIMVKQWKDKLGR